jgi:hypothetical protein
VFEAQNSVVTTLALPVAPPDTDISFSDHAFSDHAIAFEEDLVVLEQPVAIQEEPLTLDSGIIAFPEEPEPLALSQPPVTLDGSFVFRMPVVVEDSWPEPQSIAAPEPETISLTEVAAVSPREVPQIEAVIAPSPGLTETGAWWLSASIDARLPAPLETNAHDDAGWMLTPGPAVMQPEAADTREEQDTVTMVLLTPLYDLPAEVVNEGPFAPKRGAGARHAAPVPLEVVFPPPEIITVHEDACATLVIPRPVAAAAEPARVIRSTPDAIRRAQDAARRKGDTTRRRKTTPPVQDEWGLFDPSKCGFSALLEKLDEITTEKPERPDLPSYVRVVTY